MFTAASPQVKIPTLNPALIAAKKKKKKKLLVLRKRNEADSAGTTANAIGE
mgnify:CR=1 FL=1